MRILAILLVLCGVVAQAVAEPTAKLSGVVTASGKPLEGATVFIHRAWPIKGVAYYCPGCYMDCTKHAKTDAQGKWTIEKLDNTLKFELLVVAKGHVPQMTGVFNPGKTDSVKVELVARDVGAMPKEQVVRGRVFGPDGKPLPGAVVSPDMVRCPDGTGCGGLCEGLDLVAVTDDEGRFALTYAKACASMDLAVSARALAQGCFFGKVSGGVEHELRLIEGANVTGRLVRNGQPVAGVEVTMVTKNRIMGQGCMVRETIATMTDGSFAFANVNPQGEYVLSASTEQLKTGCTVPKVIKVEKDGTDVDTGDLLVERGVRVSGRVLAPKDKPIPKGAKLSLSSQLAWEGVTVDLAEDGSFHFLEVPKGEYSISLHAPGIYISHRNASADKANENMMVGRVDADITGLEIEAVGERPKRPRREAQGEPDVLPEIGGIEKHRK